MDLGAILTKDNEQMSVGPILTKIEQKLVLRPFWAKKHQEMGWRPIFDQTIHLGPMVTTKTKQCIPHPL